MKTTLIAAMAALGAALVALAFVAPAPTHAAAAGSVYRTSATDSEGDGGSNPYASPIPTRPMPDRSTAV